MASAHEPAPISLRPAERALDATSQERVALAFTLMTQFSVERAPAERAAAAAAIAEALDALGTAPELTPELQRLCGRLRRIWLALGAQEGQA